MYVYVGEVTGQIETEFSSSYRCLSSPNSLPPHGTSTEAASLLCVVCGRMRLGTRDWTEEGGGEEGREATWMTPPAPQRAHSQGCLLGAGAIPRGPSKSIFQSLYLFNHLSSSIHLGLFLPSLLIQRFLSKKPGFVQPRPKNIQSSLLVLGVETSRPEVEP